jgi:hypothetical protein
MRYSHFRAFADTIRASGETLACEYRSVLTATHHEFDSERSRFAYAEYLRALALFIDPDGFMAELESPYPEAMSAACEGEQAST